MKATMNWYCGYSMFLIDCHFCISCFYTQQLSFWLEKNKKKGLPAHSASQTKSVTLNKEEKWWYVIFLFVLLCSAVPIDTELNFDGRTPN